MNTFKTYATAAALVALTGAAQAALITDPSGATVKNDSTNLVWLKDWSYSGDAKTWAEADLWASGLIYGGYSDWRLPEVDEYLVLWTAAGSTRDGLNAYFVAPIGDYWTNTVYEKPPAPDFGFDFGFDFGEPEPDGPQRRLFNTYGGNAGYSFETSEFLTMAVREGDVIAAVPLPGSMALTGLGLIGLAFTRRRRR